mgnify:CR=1 FL=1
MRKTFRVVLVVALVAAAFCGPAMALNPQSQGHNRQAIAGGTKGLLVFGPETQQDRLPTGYVLHSGSGDYFWYNTFYMNGASTAMEAIPVKVPASETIVAPAVLYVSGSMYHWIYINATHVAPTDSVFADPLYGGLGK